MRTAGIREFKARLSQYLRDVDRGDVVLVTDRGRVIAEVRRPTLGAPAGSPVERALWALAETGELRMGMRPRPRRPRPTGIRLSDGEIDRLLEEARSEGGGA